MVSEELYDHLLNTTKKVIELLTPAIEAGCYLFTATLKSGNKILFASNEGSASNAQHLAAELCGRFVKEHMALPGIALTTDTLAITAIANDYGYEHVFARQPAESTARIQEMPPLIGHIFCTAVDDMF
jgi:D-sedoheptulose 7-phosphate isomerase